MKTEYEAKFFIDSKESYREILKKAGAKLVSPEVLMKRKTFDFKTKHWPEGEWKWGRVRDESDKITMTMKHKVADNSIDNVKETEIIVNDFDEACEMFKQCNLIENNYEESYREKWELDGAEITIDTWPALRTFTEIEGESENEIKLIAKKLGFNWKDAIFGIITQVYRKHYKDESIKLSNIKTLSFDLVKSKADLYANFNTTDVID